MLVSNTLGFNTDYYGRPKIDSCLEPASDSLGPTDRRSSGHGEAASGGDAAMDPALRPVPPLLQETLPLVRHLLLYTMDPSGGHRAPSPTAAALEETARDITARFGASLARMAVSMEQDRGPMRSTDDVERTLRAVADRMFEDRTTNWGRVITAVVFGGVLAKRAASAGVAIDPERLSAAVSAYLLEARGAWMSAHGGWEGCVSRFEGGGEGLDGVLWGGLRGALSLGVGIGILVTTWSVLRGL